MATTASSATPTTTCSPTRAPPPPAPRRAARATSASAARDRRRDGQLLLQRRRAPAPDRGLPDATFVDATGLVNWQRAVKSEQEIAYMRRAARIVERMHRAHLRADRARPAQERPRGRDLPRRHRGVAGADGYGGDYPAIVPLLPTGRRRLRAAPDLGRPVFEKGEAPSSRSPAATAATTPAVRTVFLGTPPDGCAAPRKALLEGWRRASTRPGPATAPATSPTRLRRARARRHPPRRPLRLRHRPELPARLGRAHDQPPAARDTTVLEPGMTFHFMPGLWMDDWGSRSPRAS
jgi:ectoine hydrolase